MSLSVGAISKIHNDEKGNFCLKILNIKPILQNGVASRYRLTLSDGQQQIPGMLSQQMNHLVENQVLVENSIIEVTEMMKNDIGGQKVVVLLNLSVIGKDESGSTGSNLNPQNANPYANQQQQQQPQKPPAYGSYNAPPPNPYNNAQMPQPVPQTTNPYANNSYGASSNSRPIVRESMGSSTQYMPINALNPYANKWTIKARITSKSELRRWSNAKGEGTLFSIDLLDQQGSEIRGTFFKEDADKYYPMLEEQKVYTFSGGKLKLANKQYTTIKNNYEITFDRMTEILPCSDESEIKAAQYNFVKIGDLMNIEPNSMVDILCIVKSVGELAEISLPKQGGKMLQKRELTVMDDSESEVRLTLWGDKAANNTYRWEEMPIVAFKNVKVSDFGGRSVGCTSGTSVALFPVEGQALHDWRSKFAEKGMAPPSHSISTGGGATHGMDPLMARKTAASIRDECLGQGEKPDYFTLKASVCFIKREPDPWYTACIGPDCNKKVIEGMENQWTCEKCNKQFDACRRRFMMSVVLQDSTGQAWFSAFDDVANKFLGGRSADELYQMKLNNDKAYETTFNAANFKTYLLKVRSKNEMYNDEAKVKSQILSVSPIDYADECRQLIEAIQRYN